MSDWMRTAAVFGIGVIVGELVMVTISAPYTTMCLKQSAALAISTPAENNNTPVTVEAIGQRRVEFTGGPSTYDTRRDSYTPIPFHGLYR